MKFTNFLKMLPLVTLTGCAGITIETGKVTEIDPQVEELKRLGKGAMLYVDTPPFLMIADKHKMMVFAEKNPNTFQTNNSGIRQARWTIKVMNSKPIGQCLTIKFKLMDFEYVSDHPSEFFVPANSATIAGTMMQKVWQIDGVQFVPPSSGYVTGLRVRDPVIGAERGSECDFATEDAFEDDERAYEFFSLF